MKILVLLLFLFQYAIVVQPYFVSHLANLRARVVSFQTKLIEANLDVRSNVAAVHFCTLLLVPVALPRPCIAIPPPAEEAWGLISKYYLDRSFNGQDWNEVKGRINPNYQVSSLVSTLGDKYTRYLTPSQYAAIQKYDLVGVGVLLMPDSDGDISVGAPPVPGSASERAGIKSGDKVLEVNGRGTKGRSAFDIIEELVKEEKDVVEFTVKGGNGEVSKVPLQRTFTKVSDPVSFTVKETKKDGKIGYVRISEFNSKLSTSLSTALSNLESQGVEKYVLDLRGNGGGSFQSAVDVAGFFVGPDKVATKVVDGDSKVMEFKTPSANPAILGKGDDVVVWVDKGSASASEVLATALQSNCRAIVMGEGSFGKGLIQAVYGLSDGSGLVLTVAKYVTPNGESIQGTGVQPDVREGLDLLPGISKGVEGVDWVKIKNLEGMCALPSNKNAQ
mmetsp:Transcript_16392/g.33750  ORF Transcript_16392/g.33750 Transcript_16392/m.33750 type:complete len:446 (+) Transcript_16392:7-1344(+)